MALFVARTFLFPVPIVIGIRDSDKSACTLQIKINNPYMANEKKYKKCQIKKSKKFLNKFNSPPVNNTKALKAFLHSAGLSRSEKSERFFF